MTATAEGGFLFCRTPVRQDRAKVTMDKFIQ